MLWLPTWTNTKFETSAYRIPDWNSRRKLVACTSVQLGNPPSLDRDYSSNDQKIVIEVNCERRGRAAVKTLITSHRLNELRSTVPSRTLRMKGCLVAATYIRRCFLSHVSVVPITSPFSIITSVLLLGVVYQRFRVRFSAPSGQHARVPPSKRGNNELRGEGAAEGFKL